MANENYAKYHYWIEEEVAKLEKETKISWEEQSEALKECNIEGRKVQLFIRHHLSMFVLEMI
ncbi:hypothetical protein [Paraliobacillus sp. JSM ZJ581]|uniref:hypothetical protein n=1 Tax=Paraliobacillus sp. JSM ZJ581 TaxID=3342118 RepID=UPI0035A92461